MSQNRVSARVTPPGRILTEEIEARGWTQKDLAEIVGRPPQAINEIVRGTKQITPDTALAFGEAFGTSPEFWMNLEANYRIWLAKRKQSDSKPDSRAHSQSDVARRSRLYSLAPVPDLVRRGWISGSGSLDDLERGLCAFLGISSPDDTPPLAASFRHSGDRGPELAAEVAWVRRVEQLARDQRLPRFDRDTLIAALPRLLELSERASDVSAVPDLLLSLGVHFVIVKHLPRTYLDGAAFYLDGAPVVALTLRHDRIDSFWFTLMHEIAHIAAGHSGLFLDDTSTGLRDESEASERASRDGLADAEAEADRLANDWMVPSQPLEVFVQAAAPRFSRAAIQRFARDHHRHPGIVLGRLQHDGQVGFDHLRPLLVPVRPHLEEWLDVAAPLAQAS